MTVLDQLSRLSSAEEIFQFLNVAYEPEVLNVARLHILRRMADNMRSSSSGTGDDALREYFRTNLQQAYQDFVRSTPLNERVFKVLKDAVRKKTPRLVALSIPGSKRNIEPLKSRSA